MPAVPVSPFVPAVPVSPFVPAVPVSPFVPAAPVSPFAPAVPLVPARFHDTFVSVFAHLADLEYLIAPVFLFAHATILDFVDDAAMTPPTPPIAIPAMTPVTSINDPK